jgi:uncharacterized phiE125 gp8 family phage protein
MLSAPTIVTPPAAEPLEIEDAFLFLRLDDAGSLDPEIALIVASAVADIEATTSTRLIEQTVRLHADSFNDLDHLQIGPVQRVEALTYVDELGETVVLPPGAFELTGADLERGIAPIGAWPTGAARKITVDLVVGYAQSSEDVPAQLRWALLALIRGKFEGKPVDIEPLVVNRRIYG